MPPGSMETVEETLNAMLDAEADRLCRAERYNQTTASSKVRKTLDTTCCRCSARSIESFAASQ